MPVGSNASGPSLSVWPVICLNLSRSMPPGPLPEGKRVLRKNQPAPATAPTMIRKIKTLASLVGPTCGELGVVICGSP
jgi:hypothetical protein